MVFGSRMKTVLLLLGLAGWLGTLTPALPAAEKPHLVDAGTFVVLVKGQRIATETFHIEQSPTVNTASAEFKSESGEKAVQKAELQITPAGDLRKYEWRELSPGKSQIVVEPADQFLVERIVPEPPQRPVQQSFIMPLSTVILDDYFFSQREILAWRYLAQACGGKLENCRPARTQFGVLVPRQRLPLTASLAYVGVEKVMVNGTERELNRINLRLGDDPEWALYLDGSLKVIRIDIPAESTQVIRE
jgi:hypothetical protein